MNAFSAIASGKEQPYTPRTYLAPAGLGAGRVHTHKGPAEPTPVPARVAPCRGIDLPLRVATEEVLDNEMKDLRRGQLGLEAQMAALESRFLSEIGSLRASCGAG